MLLGAIFKSVAAPRQQTTSEGYSQYAGTRMAASGKYKSPKSGFEQTKDDIMGDFFGGTRDADYYARLSDRQRKSQELSEQMMRSANKGGSSRRETAAERRAREKAEKLAERKRLGQIARKKFEKEGGERTAKRRALLLNIT